VLRIFCGNLNFETTEEQLSDFFASSGYEVVRSQIIRDKETDKSRGFGFVELRTEPQVEAAITALNMTKLQGRKIVVSEAKPKPVRTDAGAAAR
jgi:RNA recognition motif-containing protein